MLCQRKNKYQATFAKETLAFTDKYVNIIIVYLVIVLYSVFIYIVELYVCRNIWLLSL